MSIKKIENDWRLENKRYKMEVKLHNDYFGAMQLEPSFPWERKQNGSL
jgi:hypothetical protein